MSLPVLEFDTKAGPEAIRQLLGDSLSVAIACAWCLPGLQRGEPLVSEYAAKFRDDANEIGQDFARVISEAEILARSEGKSAGGFRPDLFHLGKVEEATFQKLSEMRGFPEVTRETVRRACYHVLGGHPKTTSRASLVDATAKLLAIELRCTPDRAIVAATLAHDAHMGRANSRGLLFLFSRSDAVARRAEDIFGKLADRHAYRVLETEQ